MTAHGLTSGSVKTSVTMWLFQVSKCRTESLILAKNVACFHSVLIIPMQHSSWISTEWNRMKEFNIYERHPKLLIIKINHREVHITITENTYYVHSHTHAGSLLFSVCRPTMRRHTSLSQQSLWLRNQIKADLNKIPFWMIAGKMSVVITQF